MIKIFSPADTVYNSNGDVVIRPLKAIVHKEDNGDFYLDFESDTQFTDYIVGGNIIVANTPQGDQAFRTRNVQKTRDKITLRAKHVYFDAEDYFIREYETTDPVTGDPDTQSCADILTGLNTATDRTSPFTVGSDIPGSIVNELKVENVSLADGFKATLDKFKAHIVRDNWSVTIPAEFGTDTGVTIRYGKNLQEIIRTENWDDVCTKLLPVGKDGIMLNSLDPSVNPWREVAGAEIVIAKTVQFNQDIEQAEGESEADYKGRLIVDLNDQATAYLQTHGAPQLCYEIRSNVVNITDIGDQVEVIDERLGLNVMTSVIAYDYDCIQERYTSMTLASHQTRKLSKLIDNIVDISVKNATEIAKKEIGEVKEDIQTVKDDVDELADAEAVKTTGTTADFDTLTTERYYYGNTTGATYTHGPADLSGQFLLTVFTYDTTIMQQIETYGSTPKTYRRIKTGGSWSAWA